MGGILPSWLGWLLGGLAAVTIAVGGVIILGPKEPEPAPPAEIAAIPEEGETPAPEASGEAALAADPQPEDGPESAPEAETEESVVSEAAPEAETPTPAPEPTGEAAPAVATDVPPESPVAEAPADPVSPAAEPEDVAVADPMPVAEDTAPEADAPPAVVPSFDVVRIEPGGSTLVAGRAGDAASVQIMVGSKSVAEATPDRSGNFVALFDLPPSDGARVMMLRAVSEDGTEIASVESVIIEPFAGPELVVAEAAPTEEPPSVSSAPAQVEEDEPSEMAAPVEVAPETAPEADLPALAADVLDQPVADVTTAENTVPVAESPVVAEAVETPDAPATADAPAPVVTENAPPVEDVVASADPAPEALVPAAPAVTTEAAPQVTTPAAPRVLLATPEGIEVMQDPSTTGPQLSIDTIAYDDAGEVALAGRGSSAETLRIYLDNQAIHTALVGSDGRWSAPLPEVETGVYTLRVDAVGPEGEVTSRVETPFKREEPEVLAAVGTEANAQGAPISSITVQPGNTLWAISEGRYGAGLLYVKIFQANRDQIRNPDLIYPGQVFALPDGDE